VSNVGAAASAATRGFCIGPGSAAQFQKKNKPVVENGPRLREIGGEETRA
jgi:hypothetical protein